MWVVTSWENARLLNCYALLTTTHNAPALPNTEFFAAPPTDPGAPVGGGRDLKLAPLIPPPPPGGGHACD